MEFERQLLGKEFNQVLHAWRLPALNLEVHVDITPGGMAVWTDFPVRLPHQRFCLRLLQGLNLHVHLNGDAEPIALAWTDSCLTGDLRIACVFFRWLATK